MSTYQAIRNRLKSIHNVIHITQAMELVAGVRFRKLMGRVEHFRFYAKKLTELTQRMSLGASDYPHPLFQKRPVKNIAVIIVAADKGLCGAYNQNVFRAAKKFLEPLSIENTSLVIFGTRTVEHFKNFPWTIKTAITDFSKKLTEEAVDDWSTELRKGFENEEFDELYVVYTHYKNILSKETKIEKLLPLEPLENKTVSDNVNFLYEPGPESIYQDLIPYFFSARLHAILLESYTSELAYRMMAMKAATRNAEEMIEKLTLIKNKTRQMRITSEILEITAGAENLNE